MPIRKIEFKKGKIYHIFNQGARGKVIFLNEIDKERFLQSIFLSNNQNSFRGIPALGKNRKNISIYDIKKILKREKIPTIPLVRIYSICLMPDHFHFVLKESGKNGISKFMQKLGNGYGKYLSKKYGLQGNIFSGRFKAKQVENDNQLNYLFAYINVINPAQQVEPYLRIKGVENFSAVWNRIESYKWSSHLDFMGSRDWPIIDKSVFKKTFRNPKNYSNFARDVLLGRKNDIWDILKGICID